MTQYIKPVLITFLVAVVLIGGMVFIRKQGDNPAMNQFAKCIKDSGAKFYGAFWCPHCQAQKALFGNAKTELPYIECSLPSGNGQNKTCTDIGIESYPTWIFADGTKLNGEVSLEALAEKTKCELPADK